VLLPAQEEQESSAVSIYAPAVVQATRDWLAEGVVLADPSDTEEAVEAVYGQVQSLPTESIAASPLQLLIDKQAKKERKMLQIASDVTIEKPDPERPISLAQTFYSDEDSSSGHALTARTRLEDLPSITLVLWPENTPLPEQPLTLQDKRRLAMASLQVSVPWKLLKELEALPQGGGWNRVSLLQRARLGSLNAQGEFFTVNYRFSYCKERGLTWEQTNADL
jgi:hypothetical protein